jgi:hypothetical protein
MRPLLLWEGRDRRRIVALGYIPSMAATGPSKVRGTVVMGHNALLATPAKLMRGIVRALSNYWRY